MNPILNAMIHNRPQINDVMGMIQSIRTGSISPQMMSQIENNPQFRDFVEKNKDKSPEEIASSYGIDYNMVKQFLK